MPASGVGLAARAASVAMASRVARAERPSSVNGRSQTARRDRSRCGRGGMPLGGAGGDRIDAHSGGRGIAERRAGGLYLLAEEWPVRAFCDVAMVPEPCVRNVNYLYSSCRRRKRGRHSPFRGPSVRLSGEVSVRLSRQVSLVVGHYARAASKVVVPGCSPVSPGPSIFILDIRVLL